MSMAASGRKQEKSEPWFKRHRAKLLNASLLIYLCSGALIFDHLSDSFSVSSPVRGDSVVQAVSDGNRKPAAVVSGSGQRMIGSREELRNSSAKRMWDITNKLNILYEANWTAQVLDELAEFERRLEKLESVSRDELTLHQGAERVEPVDSTKVHASGRKRSLGHLSRALIHSVAILTGEGKFK